MTNVTALLHQTAEAHAFLNKFDGFHPVLDDTDLITRVLALANKNSSLEEIANAIYCTNLSHDFLSSPADFSGLMSEPQYRNFVIRFWDDSKAVRDWFHDALVSIIDKRQPALRVLSKELDSLVKHIIIVPKLSWTGTTLQRKDIFYSSNTGGALAYVLMLLLDKERGLTKALRQCKLRDCGRFFLSLSTGGRPPLYCCREHQADYTAQSGAIRTERWRKRKAKKRGKKS